MTAGLMGVVAMAMVSLAPVVLGTNHLSFSNNTEVSITRSGCGVTKQCLETPDDCDPAGNTACLFFSVIGTPSPPSGVDLVVQLRGDSDGYIAVADASDPTMGTSDVFVCAQNSSNFFFRTAQRNNSQGDGLTLVERPVKDIRGTVNGSVIQCEFTIPLSRSNATAGPMTFTAQLGTGSVNSAGVLGDFNVSITGTINPADLIPTVSITRSGCGVSKLCLETPDDCDPAGNTACLFFSVIGTPSPPSGLDLVVQLRGDSEGYIAVATDPTMATSDVFVCAQNSSNFFFRTAQRNNSQGNGLTLVERPVKDIRGTVSGSVIQCEFTIPLSRSNATAGPMTFTAQLGTGSVNSAGVLGDFNVSITGTINPADLIPTVDITRSGCGVTKQCLETPDDCDPAGNTACLFFSVIGAPSPPSGVDLVVQLRGDSDGYIAVADASDPTMATSDVFVCAQNSSNFFFRTAQRNNSHGNGLTLVERPVKDIRGTVSGSVIQCEFTIPLSRSNATAGPMTFTAQLGTGSVNSAGVLGDFNVSITGTINPADLIPTVSITRSGCGVSKLCLETPDDCDPAGNTACLFFSVIGTPSPPSGLDLVVQLRGDSDGYIAVATDPTMATSDVFVCAQNSSNFFFRTAQRNNSHGNGLTLVERPVKDIRGTVSGSVIQCEFTIPLSRSNATAGPMTFTAQLGTGSVNSAGVLGDFNVSITGTINPADLIPTVSITRSGCGVSKLCLETPDDCDPAGNTACLFFSVIGAPSPPSGFDLVVQLRGDSDGYIAVATDPTMATSDVFVCAQNSSNFFFRTAQRNNSHGNGLTLVERPVKDIRGTVSGSVIQCEFTIPLSRSNATAGPMTFTAQLGTGSVNSAGVLGDFNVSITGTINPADLIPTVDITRSGCGVSKQCLETPDDCDPAGNTACLFFSVIGAPSPPSGLDLVVQLRGDSDGYIAVADASDPTMATSDVFVCAQNSSNFFFRTAQRNNSHGNGLTLVERPVKDIRGTVSGSVIQCEFTIPLSRSNATAGPMTFTAQLGTGSVNSAGVLGDFNVSITGTINPADLIPTVSITRSGCGVTKQCLETPDDCDPAGNTACLFFSVIGTPSPPSGFDLVVQLRGDSDGYIAVADASDPTMATSDVFVCAQNSSNFFFRTAQRNNSHGNGLTLVERPVKDIRGTVSGSVIQCEFTIPLSRSNATAGPMTFTAQLGTGSVNSAGVLGDFNVSITGTINPADLIPTVNITRSGCGVSKLCVETPDDCDPAGNTACLFASGQVTGNGLAVQLRGDSDGYIAVAATTNATMGTSAVIICARNQSCNSFFLRTAMRSNTAGGLTLVPTIVTDVRGTVNGSVIQCEFTVPAIGDGIFIVLLGTGSVNSASVLGDLTVNVTTGRLNLSDPTSNVAMTTVGPTTVGPTAFTITRSGCGNSKFCVETPDDCDPAGNTACLFFSVIASAPSPPNGFDLAVQLRGDSSGYIAIALALDATTGTSDVFACAQNQSSNSFFFLMARRDNTGGALTLVPTTVTNLRGTVSGSVIQCEFTIPMVNATASRASQSSSFVVLLGTGPVSGAGTLGDLTVNVTTDRLDLADPASNVAVTTVGPAVVVPTVVVPTVVATTASDGIALGSQAVLVLLGAVAYLLS